MLPPAPLVVILATSEVTSEATPEVTSGVKPKATSGVKPGATSGVRPGVTTSKNASSMTHEGEFKYNIIILIY